MSYSFDVFERYISTANLPKEVKIFIDALHSHSHEHDDELNRDKRIRMAAQKLEEWMDKQESNPAPSAPDAERLRERCEALAAEWADDAVANKEADNHARASAFRSCARELRDALKGEG